MSPSYPHSCYCHPAFLWSVSVSTTCPTLSLSPWCHVVTLSPRLPKLSLNCQCFRSTTPRYGLGVADLSLPVSVTIIRQSGVNTLTWMLQCQRSTVSTSLTCRVVVENPTKDHKALSGSYNQAPLTRRTNLHRAASGDGALGSGLPQMWTPQQVTRSLHQRPAETGSLGAVAASSPAAEVLLGRHVARMRGATTLQIITERSKLVLTVACRGLTPLTPRGNCGDICCASADCSCTVRLQSAIRCLQLV